MVWPASGEKVVAFEFLDPGPLIDRELELLAPEARWVDELLRTCKHPAGRNDPTSKITRQQIEEYLQAAPEGRYLPRPDQPWRVPQYQFWMRLRPEYHPTVSIVGSISVRIGDSEDLRNYLGHFGY